MNSKLRTGTAAAYLVLCLALGGASAAGIIANAAIQLTAILILLILLWRKGNEPVFAAAPLWAFGAAFLLILLLQLLPLPPAIWQALPGRAVAKDAFVQLGLPLPWLPLSLAPDSTIASALSVLPPLALLALVGSGPLSMRRIVAGTIAIFAVISLVLGVAQQSGNPHSALYFYEITNPGHAVGFFANVNHQATMLLMALPCVAGLAGPFLRKSAPRDVLPKVVVLAAILTLLSVGILLNGSRAGLAMLPMDLGLCLCMIRMDLVGRTPWYWIIATLLFIVTAIGGIAASGALSKEPLGAEPGQIGTSRAIIWHNTAGLVDDFYPAGSGLATLIPLYKMQEDPNARTHVFVNRAHNDYLEWTLETGVPGTLLLAAFLIWWARRVKRVWTHAELSLGRAGSIATGIVMIHGLLDYPIRTAAIAAIFTLACIFMLPRGDAALKGHDRSRDKT